MDMIIISSESEDSDYDKAVPGANSVTLVFTPTKRPPSPDSGGEDNAIGTVVLNDDDQWSRPAKADSPCKKMIKFELIYYNDDKQLPIFSKTACGYGFHQLIDLLMTSKVDSSKVCTVRPSGVSENATFIVDLDCIRFGDLKSDDLGSWNPTGTKSTFFRITATGIRIADKKPAAERMGMYHVLTRHYVHNTYHLYHRMIADIQDYMGNRNKMALIQYTFDGPEVEVKVKPHGNSKTETPYFRTSESAREHFQDVAKSEKPKSAVFTIGKECGGEIEVTTPSMLPRNRQQISNIRRSHLAGDKNVLYSVMLECKLARGNTEAFVRDVKAAPSPQCVMFFDWQLNDMEQFLTNNHCFGILSVDTTYNLGDFYVTLTTYPHLMLQDVNTGKHPTMVGPVLVHQQTDFSSFNYFISTLISHSKHLRNILCFGTDGDKALVEALAHNFQLAIQLRCFIHFKKNVHEKLHSLGFSSSLAKEMLSDIFGKHTGSCYSEGLVDSTSELEFDTMLEQHKDVWNKRESPFAPSSGPRFYNFFVQYQANVVKYHLRKDLREAAGLGSPPAIFTTNSSESINAMLKNKVNYKQHEWPQFNEQLKQLVEGQRDEVIRSLSGRGQYRLCAQFNYLSTSILEWSKMRPDQRKRIISQFDSASIKTEYRLEGTPKCHVSSAAQSTKLGCLSINAEDSGIETLPLITLQAMWDKASKLLTLDNAITAAPSEDKKARMVMSFSSKTPHFIATRINGQYICDTACVQWSSAKICSHVLAVAESNGELMKFLQWYTSCEPSPNITVLSMKGLPTGRAGQKGGRPKRKRSRNTEKPEQLVTITKSDVSSECGSGFNMGASTSQVNYNVVFPSTPRSPPPLISVPLTPPPTAAQQPSPPNVNPFYLKFIKGNMRVCQGCRGNLKTCDGEIPSPPFDLTVARAEQRAYRNASGTLITPISIPLSL